MGVKIPDVSMCLEYINKFLKADPNAADYSELKKRADLGYEYLAKYFGVGGTAVTVESGCPRDGIPTI